MLEKIYEEWKKDTQEFKQNPDLEELTRKVPELHAKYLELLSKTKIKLKQAEFDQNRLMKNKWLWYNGKLSQEEVEAFGWEPDPFDGLKILKGEMQHYVEADPELQESEAKIELLKNTIDTLKEIVDNLKWRHQSISNIIRWKQFEAGF